ncbi:MAG: hypothetical protein EPO13_06065 [Actinomycetota bacterium]|nr:MAG: hypothetical protein EPO13_06065 [Actinomycetota bacterium]
MSQPDPPARPTADTASPQPPDDGSTPGTDDDVRRKYREALARKKGKQSSGTGGQTGAGKASAATSNAATQRMFRRKSGG